MDNSILGINPMMVIKTSETGDTDMISRLRQGCLTTHHYTVKNHFKEAADKMLVDGGKLAVADILDLGA
jgi:hypothetical protein